MKGRADTDASATRHEVNASDLAQMGVCEQLVLLEHLEGPRRSIRRREDLSRGRVEHRRFFEESLAIQRRQCFIATLLYGEGPEVEALRGFRDEVLLRWAVGRAFIATYYTVGPSLSAWLASRPGWVRIARACLRPVVWAAMKIRAGRGGSEDV